MAEALMGELDKIASDLNDMERNGSFDNEVRETYENDGYDEPTEEKPKKVTVTRKKRVEPKGEKKEEPTETPKPKPLTKKQKKDEEKKLASVVKVAIGCLSSMLGYVGLVGDSESLKEDLAEDELVTDDVGNLMSYVVNYIPFVGLITGGFTIGRHITIHAAKSVANDNPNRTSDISAST